MSQPTIVNGFAHEWNAVEIVLAGITYLDFKSIDYDTDTDGQDVMGTASEAIARTLGNAKHTASMEMYSAAAKTFLSQLGPNYLRIPFDVVIHKAEPNSGSVLTDKLVQCTIKKIGDSHQQGSDALTTKFDLRPFRIVRGSTNGGVLQAIVSDIIDPLGGF